MNNINKGKSPFYPGQPVPVEFFIGRQNEIERIIRATAQVEMGKPQAVFLIGEYGIGKSSLASYMRYYAEKTNHLLGLHVLLGGASTIEEMTGKILEAALKSEAYESKFTEKIRTLLSSYIDSVGLFGVTIKMDAIKADSPNISQGLIPFFRELLKRLADDGIKGIMLILDEINGITNNSKFAHFIKSLIDENAISNNPLPLMLMLCGVEERRSEMIQHHRPIERIFDIVEIEPMSEKEMHDFFTKAFESINAKIENDAMHQICLFSAGFPKIMHIIGDAIYWIDKDGIISIDDATEGLLIAAEDIGRKFVDQQIYKALRSKEYHSILSKIAKEFGLSFKKNTIEKGLSQMEKRKFANFLQRMKRLNVLKTGEERGEYIFDNRMIRLYILLDSLRKSS